VKCKCSWSDGWVQEVYYEDKMALTQLSELPYNLKIVMEDCNAQIGAVNDGNQLSAIMQQEICLTTG